MIHNKLLLLSFLAVTSFGGALRAAPLDERQVAANAQWLLHVDFDALRSSQSARLLATAWLQAEPVRSHLAGIRGAIGLDVVRDLRDVTFYGEELVPDRGVLIVRAALDLSRLTAFIAQQPNYAERTSDGRLVFSWTERRGGKPHTVFASMLDGQGMVFSRSAADLDAALAVMDGGASCLAESDSALKGPAPSGSVLLVRATGLSDAKLALKSPILRLSESMAITAGEESGAAFIEARLTATSAEHVPHLRAVATGLVALARLMRTDDEDILKLLDAVTIDAENRTVSARWSGELADVLSAAGNEQLRLRYD